MLVSAFVLIALAILLLWISSRQRRELGLPTGRIVYSDTNQWESVAQPFYDPKTGLAGKPDYLIQHKKSFIPVEVKSNLKGQQPYQSHIFQLAAYCYLIEQNYNNRPDYGILYYPSRTFAIDYTEELESKLHQIIYELRKCENGIEPHRSHESIARCKHCGYRDICDQKIE
jgi:CRISPR-associated exonuclease Cas4